MCGFPSLLYRRILVRKVPCATLDRSLFCVEQGAQRSLFARGCRVWLAAVERLHVPFFILCAMWLVGLYSSQSTVANTTSYTVPNTTSYMPRCAVLLLRYPEYIRACHKSGYDMEASPLLGSSPLGGAVFLGVGA